MRLIDADALIHDITKLYCGDCEKRKGVKNGKLKFVYEIGDAPCRACQLDDMKDVIENAPTVDAKPIRHGHWEKLKDDNDRWRCSHCGNVYIGFNGIDSTFAEICYYCPHCGALMEQEVEEEMKTCDRCQYCYEQSNHYKGAEIHTIHYRCRLIEKAVNPYNSCEMWKERKGKMKIRYKDGEMEEVKE